MTLAEIDHANWVECWQCNGVGALAGCFKDCCCGADCDPEDPVYCCAPETCDECNGAGGWNANDEKAAPCSET